MYPNRLGYVSKCLVAMRACVVFGSGSRGVPPSAVPPLRLFRLDCAVYKTGVTKQSSFNPSVFVVFVLSRAKISHIVTLVCIDQNIAACLGCERFFQTVSFTVDISHKLPGGSVT